MALINCPECNGKVSDMANICVHCGYPLNPDNVYGIPTFLKINDIMKILNCGKNVAYKLITSKSIPYVQIGRNYYIPRDKFIKWISDSSNRHRKYDLD